MLRSKENEILLNFNGVLYFKSQTFAWFYKNKANENLTFVCSKYLANILKIINISVNGISKNAVI